MNQYVIVHAVPAMKVSLNCRFLYNLYYFFLKPSVSKYRSWVFFYGAESSEFKAFRSDKINYVLYCKYWSWIQSVYVIVDIFKGPVS